MALTETASADIADKTEKAILLHASLLALHVKKNTNNTSQIMAVIFINFAP
jgi:hypothetical protein